MQDTDLNVIAERMQQVLERDYAYLEWRVLMQSEAGAEADAESWLFVHARTRDFRYGCRIGRSRTAVLQAPTLRFLVADLVAEVEGRLADRATAAS
jgi:PhoPQ-activated pathogenicity-related protein